MRPSYCQRQSAGKRLVLLDRKAKPVTACGSNLTTANYVSERSSLLSSMPRQRRISTLTANNRNLTSSCSSSQPRKDILQHTLSHRWPLSSSSRQRHAATFSTSSKNATVHQEGDGTASSKSDQKAVATSRNSTFSVGHPASSIGLELGTLESDLLLQRTKELCNEDIVPCGSFTNLLWQEALDEVLQQWTKMATPESVDYSFWLLERLVLEHQQQAVERIQHHPRLSDQLFNTNLLNAVIQNWHQTWKQPKYHQQQHFAQQQTSQSPESQHSTSFLSRNTNQETQHQLSYSMKSSWNPQQILQHVDDYHRRSPNLAPNISTYSMILDAVTFWAEMSQNNRRIHHHHITAVSEENLSQLVESLESRMWPNKGASNNLKTISVRTNASQPGKFIDETSAYNILINAYSATGNADRAEQKLQEMLETASIHEDQVQDDSLAARSTTRKNSKDHQGKHHSIMVRPDLRTFNTVLKALSRSSKEDAPILAEALLSRMTNIPIGDGTTVASSSAAPKAKQDGHLSLSAVEEPTSQHRRHMNDASVREKTNKISQHHHYYIQPDTVSFNTVLHCWAQRGAGERAETILHQMERLHRQGGGDVHNVQPDSISYATVINAWAKAGNARRAEQILQRMYNIYQKQQQEQHSAGNEKDTIVVVKPNIRTFNTVLSAWSNVKSTKDQQLAPFRVEAILQHMHQLSGSTSDSSFNANTAATTLSSSSPSNSWLAQDHWTTDDAQPLDVAPDVVSYTALLQCWANSDRPEAIERIQSILDKMEEKHKDHSKRSDDDSYHHADIGEKSVSPNTFSYTTALQAFAKRGDPVRAEKLLLRMLDDYYHRGKKHAVPTIHSFAIVLNAWARCPPAPERTIEERAAPPERAEAILRRMQELSSNNISSNHTTQGGGGGGLLQHLKPDSVIYNSVLNCWAKSGHPDAGVRAEAILKEMEKHADHTTNTHQQDHAIVQPDVISYNTTLHALASVGNANRAEELFREMIATGFAQPNVQTLNTVLLSWLHRSKVSRDAPKRAQELLQQQLRTDASVHPVYPDVISFNTVLNCWANSSDPKAGQKAQVVLDAMMEKAKLQPDQISYSATISAWSKSRNATKAEQVLQQMINDFNRTGNPSSKPTVKTLNAVLNAWSRSKQIDAPNRAQNILRSWIAMDWNGLQAQPNLVSYNSVLNCWANSKQKRAAERAAALLLNMESQEDLPNPDTISFNTVIKAFSKVGNARSAETLLQRMFDDYFHLGSHHVKPNLNTFNTVLNAWAKSGEDNAASRAEEILRNMTDLTSSGVLEVQPNVVSYSAVLNCWANSSDKSAGERTEEILAEMNRRSAGVIRGNALTKPDVIAYNSALKAWAKDGNALQAEKLLQRMLEDSEFDRAIEPNNHSLTFVVDAWARSKRSDAPDMAEAFLRRMQDIASTRSLKSLPNARVYTSVVACWASSKRSDAGIRAESMLEEVKQHGQSGNPALQPDTVLYQKVVDAWTWSQDKTVAGNRVAALFHEGLDGFIEGNGKLEPDKHLLNTVLDIMLEATSDRNEHTDLPVTAQGIVDRIADLHKAEKLRLHPDVMTYTTLMQCWAKSGRVDAGTRAEAVLETMENLTWPEKSTVKPNDGAYKVVADTWEKLGNTSRAEEVLKRI